MSLPSLADLADVEALLVEPLTGRHRDRAVAVLEAVSAEAREVTGRSWTDAAGHLVADRPGILAATVARASERAIRNPGQLSAENLGDYGRRFSGDAPAGVYLTEGERAALSRLVDLGPLVSVPVERDVAVSDRPWQVERW